MTAQFRNALDESIRLTRAGQLEAATQVIQRALQLHGRPAPAGLPARTAKAAPMAGAMPSPMPMPSSRTRHPLAPRAAVDDERFITGRHTAAGLVRDYKLFVPSAPPPGPRPLVVMLHGCTQDPDDFAAGTAMNAAAQAGGFYVLYPWQSNQANPRACWNWFKPEHQARGRGEPAVIADMAQAIARQHPIDATRVYVAGLSAGGAMAAIVGEAYPDVFAAVGVHSGLPVGAAGDLPSALAAMRSGPQGAPAGAALAPPTIVFHGDADTVVHAANGEAAFLRSAGASQAAPESARVGGHGRHCTRRTVRNAGGAVHAEHWTIHGAAHAWSGGSADGSYTDPHGPCATTEMLRFFSAHRRAGAPA